MVVKRIKHIFFKIFIKSCEKYKKVLAKYIVPVL